MGRRIVFLAAVALTLAACGSSSTTPLTASQLAHKIPGCHGFLDNTPSVLATGDVSCNVGGVSDEVVTFASMSSETRWIQAQGQWYGCCVAGHLWAAFYNSGTPYNGFTPIIKALGGREVSG